MKNMNRLLFSLSTIAILSSCGAGKPLVKAEQKAQIKDVEEKLRVYSSNPANIDACEFQKQADARKYPIKRAETLFKFISCIPECDNEKDIKRAKKIADNEFSRTAKRIVKSANEKCVEINIVKDSFGKPEITCKL